MDFERKKKVKICIHVNLEKNQEQKFIWKID